MQVDSKLHRSGRHPDDIFWSNNPKYRKMATVVGIRVGYRFSPRHVASKKAPVRVYTREWSGVRQPYSSCGRQTSGDDAVLFMHMKSEEEAVKKKQTARNARLKMMRKATKGEGMDSLTDKLRTIFKAYADFRVLRENRRSGLYTS